MLRVGSRVGSDVGLRRGGCGAPSRVAPPLKSASSPLSNFKCIGLQVVCICTNLTFVAMDSELVRDGKAPQLVSDACPCQPGRGTGSPPNVSSQSSEIELQAGSSPERICRARLRCVQAARSTARGAQNERPVVAHTNAQQMSAKVYNIAFLMHERCRQALTARGRKVGDRYGANRRLQRQEQNALRGLV